MASVLKELEQMFSRAIEDTKKAQYLRPWKCNVKDAANRFIKLARRFYDIYKLFIDEYRVTIDVIAARCMLLFVRACFIVSNLIFETTWNSRQSMRRTLTRLGTAPKRAAHKIVKRTLKKKEYVYNHADCDYEKHGFVKLFANDNERKPYDELINVAQGLKEMGSRLVLLFDECSLIDPSATLESINKTLAEDVTYKLTDAKADLFKCAETLKAYYMVIIEELVQERSDGREERDLCIVPLMERLGMEPRLKLRGFAKERKKKSTLLDIRAATDINEVTTKIILLDLAPMN